MKFQEFSLKNKIEINDDKTIIDIDKKPLASSGDNDYFERIFYGTINVFAYSKFYDITIDAHEKCNIEYINFLKSLYSNFRKEEKVNSDLLGERTYSNFVMIIDEFCAEKFRNFIDISNSSSNRGEVDKKISEFLSSNNQNIALIRDESIKNPNYENLEIIIKDLQQQDPKRFKNLIDFEIDRIELKKANEHLLLTIGDLKIKPSALFLKEVKECSRLNAMGLAKSKKNSPCIIS